MTIYNTQRLKRVNIVLTGLQVRSSHMAMSQCQWCKCPSFQWPAESKLMSSKIPEYCSQQCRSDRWQWWKCARIFTQPIVRLTCDVRWWADYRFKMAITQSRLTTQARRQHTFLLLFRSLILSSVLSLNSDVSLLLSLQFHVLYRQSRIWKCLRHSSSLDHLKETSVLHSSDHFVAQAVLPFVRQMAHNMNTDRFT